MPNRRVSIVGIVNITPDSFSDGGKYFNPDHAVQRTLELLEQGADFVDFGAESSRPGAKSLTTAEEWSRIEPYLESCSKHTGLISKLSIDTYHDKNMLHAAHAGVRFINNIKGLAQKATLRELAQFECRYAAMHIYKKPADMQTSPLSAQAAKIEIDASFQLFRQELLECGFERDHIYLDPGIGFGKTDEANWQILQLTQEWAKYYQLYLGISRKSFIGRWLNIDDPISRDYASHALEAGLMMQGANVIRTHEVEPLIKVRKLLGLDA